MSMGNGFHEEHKVDCKISDVLYIVMPAYNEEENIENVIKAWYSVVEEYNGGGKSRLVVVNDGSKDNTYRVALEMVKNYPLLEIVDKDNSGHGATVLFAYQYALNHGADYIFQTDSDGQTNPDEFHVFWKQRKEYDMVIGHRYKREDGLSRKFVTLTLKQTLKLAFGVDVTDANTPFRLMSRPSLQECMKYVPEDFNLSNVVLTVAYVKNDFKVKFEPITFKPRQGGVNSINMKKIMHIGLNSLRDFGKINIGLKSENNIRGREYRHIFIGAAFMFLLFVTSYKLTNASLWVDETTEYFFSKYLFEMPDSVPDMGWNLHNMYERIVFTYQPPLYNVVMYFWLKFSDSEWWLRAFGVLMSFIGGLGTFRAIKKVTKSEIVSTASIFLYALNYRQTFYWQEAAEYCLMLGLVPWIIVFFLELTEKPTKKNIIMTVLFCVLAVYSQYGAAFPVIAVLFLSLVCVVLTHNRKLIGYTASIYAGAALFTALPLYVFFLQKQMKNQGSSLRIQNNFEWSEFVKNTQKVFEWNMITSIGNSGRKFLAFMGIVLLVFSVIYLFRGKKVQLRYLVAANFICYIIYFLCVIWGAYADGMFGERYNVFLIPIWFITGIILLYQLTFSLRSFMTLSVLRPVPYVVEGMIIIMLMCYGYINWTSLSTNWQKEDNRGITKAWIEQKCYNSSTITYYCASMPFSYYLHHDEQYCADMENNVVYQKWDRGQTAEHYRDYYDMVYGTGNWPDDLYIIAVHFRDDLERMLEPFTDEGYVMQDTYSGYGARLIHIFQE